MTRGRKEKCKGKRAVARDLLGGEEGKKAKINLSWKIRTNGKDLPWLPGAKVKFRGEGNLR